MAKGEVKRTETVTATVTLSEEEVAMVFNALKAYAWPGSEAEELKDFFAILHWQI